MPLRRALRAILLMCGLRPTQVQPDQVRSAVGRAMSATTSDPFANPGPILRSRRKHASGRGSAGSRRRQRGGIAAPATSRTTGVATGSALRRP